MQTSSAAVTEFDTKIRDKQNVRFFRLNVQLSDERSSLELQS